MARVGDVIISFDEETKTVMERFIMAIDEFKEIVETVHKSAQQINPDELPPFGATVTELANTDTAGNKIK